MKNEKSATEKIYLEVDNDKAFDYETGKSDIYILEDYRAIIQKEASEIH